MFMLVIMSLYHNLSQAVTVDQFYPFGADSEKTLLTNQQKLQTTYAMCLPFEIPTSTASTNSVYRVSLMN